MTLNMRVCECVCVVRGSSSCCVCQSPKQVALIPLSVCVRREGRLELRNGVLLLVFKNVPKPELRKLKFMLSVKKVSSENLAEKEPKTF